MKLFSCATYFQPTFLNGGYYNFLDSSLIEVEHKNPLYTYAHLPPDAYELRVDYYAKIKKDINLKEWSDHLGISIQKVEDILYKEKKVKDIENQEFLTYLKFLKDFSKASDLYGDNQTALITAQIQNIKELFTDSKSDFFRLRYAYNIIRAYHYIGEYKKELDFIKSVQNLRAQKSIVWEWIDSLYAGALQNSGEIVNSSYLFAKIFQTHKSDAYIGYYDFKITSDEQWKKLLSMAKSDEEKLIFHFLRAINPKNSMIQEIKQMLSITKSSPWIDRLIYLSAQVSQYKFFNKSKDKEIYLKKFITLLEKREDKSEFDSYVLAYFSLLMDKKSPNLANKKYQNLLLYLEYMQNLKVIDEDVISKKLATLKESITTKEVYKNIKLFTLHRLSKLYPKDGIKQMLCSVYVSDNYWDYLDKRAALSIKKLDSYLAFKSKKKNLLEETMLMGDLKLTKDEINLYYGILYSATGEFKKSLKFVKKLKVPLIYDEWSDKVEQRASQYNPFNTNHSGDNRGVKRSFYTHEKFLKTLLKIRKTLAINPASTMDNFLLATAWFNSSTFGNSPMFSMIYRSTISIYKINIQSESQKLKYAKQYYTKALKHSKKREFRAKILYQLLKVAMGEAFLTDAKNSDYYNFTPEFGTGEVTKLLKNSELYRKYYKQLDGYKDTKYFKQKIKQCAVFKNYK